MEHSTSGSTFKKSPFVRKGSRLIFLASFLFTSLLAAQQADLRPYVTEGQDCVSNDVQLVSARLSSETCTTCSPGDILTVDLLITVRHNTNSDRPALAVFGDLTTTFPDGSSSTSDFIKCSGPIIPKGKVLNGTLVNSGGNGIQTINYGQVSYVCGSQLEVNNILVAWTVPSDGDCPIVDSNPHPKCGFQEGSLVIIPPLQATADALCSPESLIDLNVLGGYAPYNYNWTGPNGFTSNQEDLSDVAPGTYSVTITDSQGCTVGTSTTQVDCCEFFATPNLDPTEQQIEGCDISDLPAALTSPEDVFTNITEKPCGNLVMTHSDTLTDPECSDGLVATRSYTLFDDLNDNNTLDDDEEFVTDNHNFRIVDTVLPAFSGSLPDDTVAAYTNIPNPAVLTATDNCDTNPQIDFNETYNGDNTGTTYTIIRTWAVSDCAGNSVEHVQHIYVTENGDPIGLAINDMSVNEDNSTATFSVTLTGITTSGFTVNFNSTNGSAVATDDYVVQAGTLSFNGTHGETKSIVATINDDDIVEETENYTIALSQLSTNEIGINDANGLGTIVDNDSASMSIGDIDVIESAGLIDISVVLNGNVEESFTLDFATADGTAIAGNDYTANSGQITFPSNASNGSVQNIQVAINDDNLIEPTEDFVTTISNIIASGDVSISDDQATISILDNDAVAGTGISFESTDVTVDEDAGTATFNVVLTGNVPGGFTLDFATADGTAIAGNDYTANSGQLTFNGNDGESHPINIAISDDSLIEPTEGFTVNLSNISTALIGINTPQANGNINDNDGVAGTGISFESTDVTVDEDAGTATFNVVLTGNVPGGFTLDFATADGTAIAGNDYTANSGQLTFTGNDGESHPINIAISDDNLIEPTEGLHRRPLQYLNRTDRDQHPTGKREHKRQRRRSGYRYLLREHRRDRRRGCRDGYLQRGTHRERARRVHTGLRHRRRNGHRGQRLYSKQRTAHLQRERRGIPPHQHRHLRR